MRRCAGPSRLIGDALIDVRGTRSLRRAMVGPADLTNTSAAGGALSTGAASAVARQGEPEGPTFTTRRRRLEQRWCDRQRHVRESRGALACVAPDAGLSLAKPAAGGQARRVE